MTTQLQQRGCRECHEVEWHSATCGYNLRPLSRATAVDDSERESGEPEVPDVIWVTRFEIEASTITTEQTWPDQHQYRRVETCRWARLNSSGPVSWKTECGNFSQHNREENQNFCGFCGGKLEVGKQWLT